MNEKILKRKSNEEKVTVRDNVQETKKKKTETSEVVEFRELINHKTKTNNGRLKTTVAKAFTTKERVFQSAFPKDLPLRSAGLLNTSGPGIIPKAPPSSPVKGIKLCMIEEAKLCAHFEVLQTN